MDYAVFKQDMTFYQQKMIEVAIQETLTFLEIEMKKSSCTEEELHRLQQQREQLAETLHKLIVFTAADSVDAFRAYLLQQGWEYDEESVGYTFYVRRMKYRDVGYDRTALPKNPQYRYYEKDILGTMKEVAKIEDKSPYTILCEIREIAQKQKGTEA